MAYQTFTLKCPLHVSAIATLYYFSYTPDFVSRWDEHDFWELIYVDHGTTIIQTENGIFPLETGQVVLHRPNVRHRLQCDGTHNANVFIASFVCRSPIMRHFGNGPLTLPPAARSLIISLIECGAQTFNCRKSVIPLENAPLAGQQMVRNYLEILLIHLLRVAEHQESAADNPSLLESAPLPADKIMAYLNDHVYERVTIEQLCEVFHYQKSRLCALFKKQTGKTIITYFTERKIETAKELMRQGKSMGQIATLLQFDTPQYFSRIFRTYTGLSPRAYRSTLMFDVNHRVKKRQLNTPKTQENGPDFSVNKKI